MGASQVSGMKMRNLLFGLILGLLAVVHSTPVDTVTQIPAKAEDDFLREAVTDGFLVEHLFTPSRATESPKRNTTVQASQQPSTASKQDDTIEGSGNDTESMTSVFHKFASTTQSSTATVLPGNTDSSSSQSSTTQSLQSTTTSTLSPNEAQPNVTPDHISHSQTTDPAVSSFGFLSTHSSEGSGDGEVFGHHSSTTTSTTSSSSTETSTASPSSAAASVRPKLPVMFGGNEESGSGEGSGSGSGSGSGIYSTTVSTTTEMPKILILKEKARSGLGEEPMSPTTEGGNKSRMSEAPVVIQVIQPQQQPIPTEPTNKGHVTPGWIIILGFIVGLAALIMLFVAIATRDKWNGPSKASQVVSSTNSSNQQRGLEMETFLHKDQPRENGKASEYTVIPLDELPEKCSSH